MKTTITKQAGAVRQLETRLDDPVLEEAVRVIAEATRMEDETTFTKGPWETFQFSGGKTPHGHQSMFRGWGINSQDQNSPDGAFRICDIPECVPNHTPDEQEANARLIAASPTLYAFAVSQADAGNKDAKKMIDSLNLSAGKGAGKEGTQGNPARG